MGIALITNNILSDSGSPLTSVITGSLTNNKIPKATGAATLADSIITEASGAITVSGAAVDNYVASFINTDADPASSGVYVQSDGPVFVAQNSSLITGISLFPGGDGDFSGDLTANKYIKIGGTSSQFLMADGSVSTGPSLTGYVPYTGATANVNLGTYSLTATGITVNKSAGISTITFPAGTNDPGFIQHIESTANTGIMRFSVGDDNDSNDYFAFGNNNVPDAFRINAMGTVSIGVWQATAITDTYIASAATWNAKQSAITLTTTGSSGAATFTSNTLNIPNYGTALSGYLPLTGGTLTGMLNGKTFVFTTSTNSAPAGVVENLGSTNAHGLYVNIGSSSTGYGFRVDKNGSALFTVANTGAATFSNTGSFGNNLTVAGDYIQTANSVFKNTVHELYLQTDGVKDIVFRPATVEKMRLSTSGALSVTGSVTAATGINAIGQEQAFTFQRTSGTVSDVYSFNADSGSAYLYNNTTSSYLMRWLEGGNVLIGTTTDAGYKLDVNGTLRVVGDINYTSGSAIYPRTTAVTDWYLLKHNSALDRIDNAMGTNRPYTIGNFIGGTYTANIFLNGGGSATFNSTVTATAFFESSDATIKELLVDNYQTKGIESVVAKLYTKNGKEELGYYAQDVQGILPSAVSKGEDGLLSLSYREVHTAKIARLEKELEELKARLN